MKNVLCTCLLVTNVKNNTNGQTTDNFRGKWNNYKLKIKILKEEKSAYMNIYTNIFKVKGILSF